MDVFEAQEVARRHSVRLVALFGLAVLGIVASACVVVAGILALSGEAPGGPLAPGLLLPVTAGTLLVVGGGSLWKLHELRRGGRVVAEALGGRLLVAAGADWRERRLLNVVEELAIAAGIPPPAVYLLEGEAGINAFAAGHAPQDAVIGVTRGALERLDRAQLQGVVAHELSHVLNGDMRLGLRLIGVLHGILLLGLLGQAILRGASRVRVRGRGKGGGGVAVVLAIGLGLLVVGFAGVFLGQWIKAAVCRQREYLADASGAQFTRDPLGLAGALKVIGALAAGSRLVAPRAAEASHLYFARGLAPGLQSPFATHPPLPERIRRLDPAWDGRFPALPREPAADEAGPPPPPAPPGDVDAPRVWRLDEAAAGALAVARAGRPTPAHVTHAAALLAALPEELRAAAHEAWSARAVVCALLVHPEGAARDAQLARIDARADPGLADATRRLLPLTRALPTAARLPLLDLAIPALRALSPAQHVAFRALLDRLFAADGALDLFEWSLARILRRHLDAAQDGPAPPPRPARSLLDLRAEVATLLSALARAGARGAPSEAARAASALDRAADVLHLPGLSLLPAEACGAHALDPALEALAALTPLRRRELLAACAACVVADGQVRVEEVELLRAFADGLGCPLPPLLPEG